MKNKVVISVEMKQHCQGCGSVFYVKNFIEPVVFENEQYAWDMIKLAKHQLDHAECPECKKVMVGIDYHRIIE